MRSIYERLILAWWRLVANVLWHVPWNPSPLTWRWKAYVWADGHAWADEQVMEARRRGRKCGVE